MNLANNHLSIKEKTGYAMGDVASNLYFQTFILFLTYFYTDVFGISAGAVATLFLVTRVWDAINDPLMGMIADRTETRMGKFRPYILWFALPFGIVGVLTFTTPEFSESGKLVYAYVTYISLIMLYTVVNVPYSALMGVLTPDSRERTVVSSYRMVAAFIAGFIVQASTMTLVKRLGGENEQAGWMWAMSILSGLAVVLLIITFFSTKERVHPPKDQQTDMRQDLKDLFSNFPWVCIAVVSVLQLIMIVVRNGNIMYYFKYYVQSVELSLFGKSVSLGYEAAASTYMLTGTVISIIAAITINWVAKKYGKKNSFLWLLILFILVSIVTFFFRPQDFVWMMITQLVAAYSQGAIGVLQWSIFPDTADYSEYKTGRRATGLLMASSLFSIKLGLALGGAILGLLLSWFGFVANVKQSEEALIGIRLCLSLVPGLFAVLAGVMMWFYPLKDEKILEIEAELGRRRAEGK